MCERTPGGLRPFRGLRDIEPLPKVAWATPCASAPTRSSPAPLPAMPPTSTLRTTLAGAALSLLALVALAPSSLAQTCPGVTDTFWKNDTLPDNPSGSFGISVIPGLCEGEGAATVFNLVPGTPLQKLTQVVCPFGSAGGASGATALVNVQVFDGVTFSGPANTPILGPKVFDLGADFGNSMQVTSTGLNVLDMSNYNVTVGASGTGNFVVAFVMEFNPNGNCATGFTSNFFTDNSAPGFFCNPAITPEKTSLMYILGQGWTDASKAAVTGVPLCPFFYAGIWAIRACTEDAGPVNPLQVTVAGSPVPPGGFVNLTFNAPGFQGVPYVAACSFGNTPGTPTASGVVPLNFDALMSLSLSAPTVFVNFVGVVSPTGTAPGLIFIPNDPAYSGISFYVGFITLPPAPTPWGISDSAQIVIQ